MGKPGGEMLGLIKLTVLWTTEFRLSLENDCMRYHQVL